MKKVRLALLLVCLFSLLMLTLVSCGPELKSPTGLYLDQDTLTLRWNEVNGARFYAVTTAAVRGLVEVHSNKLFLVVHFFDFEGKDDFFNFTGDTGDVTFAGFVGEVDLFDELLG